MRLNENLELTRGSLIRLQQPDNGRIALGTFNELLQRQSTCGAETKKKDSVTSSSTCDRALTHSTPSKK
ncbi:hypothetical protein INR49_028626 [Caranx melampygus]|nr:hypothetical protein INR49_028626 [Caranx melampygus]